MNYLFIYQNFPAQYVHVARYLAEIGHRVVCITQQRARQIPGVQQVVYPSPRARPDAHPYLAEFDLAVANGLCVASRGEALKQRGFTPDLIVGHNGWGEILYMKDIWPSVPLLGYFEFFYRAEGSDVDFDPEFPASNDDAMRLRTRNATNLLGLDAADWGQTPTEWQRSQYPERYWRRISVLHEGIDTDIVHPVRRARVWLDGGLSFSSDDEIITYSARNLEPYRGFHIFMRALPDVLRRQRMRDFQSTICRGQSWNWRSQLSSKEELLKVCRRTLNASPVHPRLAEERKRSIGFVVPLAEFGGVEKTAYNLARIVRDHGWSTHLFVFCRQAAQPASLITEIFDSVNFLCDPQVGSWDPQFRYMGSHYPSWVAIGRHSRALGLLCGLDAVANFHCAEAHVLMAPLQRQGTKTIASLHVTDLSEFERPKGHTYLTLYEHAYDLVACCSQQLLDWCHAMGVPEGKLSLLWNAPSYDLPAAVAETALRNRRDRKAGCLRVLFLGRLDRQKGLDRLTAIARLSRNVGLKLEWRLVGASVMGDASRHELEQLSIAIEPPKLTAEELTQCYSWADVVLLVSRWEGLPLTILEAMRLGAIVCTTAVGAVAEAITHNVTGFLLPAHGSSAIARDAVKILQTLGRDRALMRRISSAAAEAAKAWTWENSAKDFVARLERLITG